jgi:hypothetical protein
VHPASAATARWSRLAMTDGLTTCLKDAKEMHYLLHDLSFATVAFFA